MNLYATPADMIARAPELANEPAALLLDLLDIASREIEAYCGRVFWTRSEARELTAVAADLCVTREDLLAVTALETDEDGDGVHEAAWTAADWQGWPANRLPWQALQRAVLGSRYFPVRERGVKVTGSWGYGDGRRSAPWDAAATAAGVAVTLTVATAGGVTATLSAAGVIVAGQTLLVETEQVFVKAVSGTAATLERGVNGTVAAAHAAASASVACYPGLVRAAALELALRGWNTRKATDFQSEKFGNDYSYTRATSPYAAPTDEQLKLRYLGAVRRVSAA